MSRASKRAQEGTVNTLSRSEGNRPRDLLGPGAGGVNTRLPGGPPAASHPVEAGRGAGAGAARRPAPRPGRESDQVPDARYRFLARFGATILSGGIAAIPTSLYHYQAQLGLVPQEVWFVGYILAHRWTDALPYPSLRQMSRRTGISTQMLHRYKQSLVEKGYLTTIPRHRPSGGRTSNFYDFSGLFDRLEQLLRGDRRDTAWQPTADDDAGGDDVGDDSVKETTPSNAGGVTPSQQDQALEVVSWGDVMARGRQRALSGPQRAPLSEPRHAGWPGAGPSASPGPGMPSAPQETRLSPQEPNRRVTRSAPVGDRTTERVLHSGRTPNDTPVAVSPTPRAENGGPTSGATRPSAADPATDPAVQRWRAARAILAETISPAAFSAWLSSLIPVTLVTSAPAIERALAGSRSALDRLEPADHPGCSVDALGASETDSPGTATPPGTARLVLACTSNFQREHVERRYRTAIEAALGTGCELVVRDSPASPCAPDSHER